MTLHSAIVSAEWLASQLDNPQVTIIDCRFALSNPGLGRQEYQVSHIPGAYYLDLNQDLSAPVEKHGGRHPLPNPEQFTKKLANMGVTSETLVVAYDDSRLAFAARLWWLLRYLGHERVAVLDGGWSGWKNAGYETTSLPPKPRLGKITPNLQFDWVVDIEAVKLRQSQPTVTLVDSRERDRYLGKHEPIDPIAGHISGALNFPWQEVTDTQGYILSIPEQKERWTTLHNAQEIIVYCGSGVTACVNLLSLNLAGMTVGKLYAGSWSDWCSYLVPSNSP